MSEWIQIYWTCMAFLFGTCVGSFLNVCVHRLPRGLSVVHPPSHCPQCNTRIAWYDNIPLVSYIALAGHCRKCDVWISPRYFLVEMLTGVLFLTVWFTASGLVIPVYWILVGGLIAATFIDFEHYIIPDSLTIGGMVLGVALSILVPSLHAFGGQSVSLWVGLRESVLGLVVGGGVVYGIVEFGKKLFGRRNLKVKADSVVRLTDRCVMVAERSIPLASLFANGTESIAFRARRVSFYDIQYENVACSLTPTALSIGDDMGELKDLGDVDVVLDEPMAITVPSVTGEASEGLVAEGNEVLTLEPGTELTICDRRLMAEDVKDGAEDFPFVELFYRSGDRIRFHADSMRCAGRTFEKVDVRLSDTALEVGEESIPLATALPVEATTSQVVIPREAMGFGDVKLMAAIGAFLGWKATIFTLMVSSVLGSAVGLTLIACRMRAWQSKIPYGPYIAAGALIWMFGGKGWVEMYMELFHY